MRLGTGMLGSGFHESSFERALSWEPDFIGCDAGSTDSRSGSLGSGVPAQPQKGIKRDPRLGLLAASTPRAASRRSLRDRWRRATSRRPISSVANSLRPLRTGGPLT